MFFLLFVIQVAVFLSLLAVSLAAPGYAPAISVGHAPLAVAHAAPIVAHAAPVVAHAAPVAVAHAAPAVDYFVSLRILLISYNI